MEANLIPREFPLMSSHWHDIPLRVRRGLSLAEVQFTCIDAVEQFIAIGTNIGVVYWCNRMTNKVDRLRPEKPGSSVTCLRIVSSVDYMVAFGDNRGIISIFVIPKEKPDCLPADQTLTLKNSVERFTASGIHASAVTAVEWSLNGQKLFTGDEKGIVGFTQMDFHLVILNIIKSTEILNEKFPIVQLCYSQPHLLLIASEYRCVIYNQVGENRMHQVGQKERLTPGKLGAVIGFHSSVQGPTIYSARPKQRIWLADTKGQVCKTFLFEEALSQTYSEIELYSPNQNQRILPTSSAANLPLQNMLSNIEFSFLRFYLGKFLLVHDAKGLILLDPEANSVVAGLHLRKIVSVATYKDEIFILEGCRRIRRFALSEDPYSKSNTYRGQDSPDSAIDLLRGVVSKIKNEASEIVVKPLLDNLKKVEQSILENDISPAEEALNLNFTMRKKTVSTQNNTENHANSILFNETVSSINSNDESSEKSSIVSNLSAATAEEFQTDGNVEESQSTSFHLPLEEIPEDIIPDMRSPESLMRDLMAKEEEFSRLLNLNILTNCVSTQSTITPQNVVEISEICDTKLSPSFSPSEVESPEIDMAPQPEKKANDENDDEVTKDSKKDTLQQCNDLDEVQNCCEGSWKQLNLPFSPKWICVSTGKVYVGESNLSVYCCDTKSRRFQWTKQKYRALKLAFSPSGNIRWKLDPNIACAYHHSSDKWKLTVREINCVDVNDTSAWYICKGQIYVQLNLNRETPCNDEAMKIECPVTPSKISVLNKAVWILSSQGQIFSRNEISENNPVGSSWKKIVHPENVIISDIVLGCRSSGWIVDKHNDFYFTDNYDEKSVNWWKVIVGQHVYGTDTSLSNQLSKFVNWSSSPALVGSDESSIWVVNAGDNSVFVNKTAIIGHRWIPFGMTKYFETKWKFISASGLNEETSVLWCVNTDNNIFLYQKSTEVFRQAQVPTTKEILCITAAQNAFWILTEDGSIFSRVGISESNPFGCVWEEFELSKDVSNPLAFKQLSCSTGIIWGIDSNDEVYAAAQDPSAIADNLSSLDWKRVENLTSCDFKLTDIIVGHNKCMVWAIDAKHNVYVRQAIFEDFPFGTEWVIVPGIKANNLTISNSAVWALATDGTIYRRFGISSTNFIGDYWMQIPGLLTLICASPSEDIWGISKMHGRLQRYERHILGISEDYVDRRRFSENLDDEWEIIS